MLPTLLYRLTLGLSHPVGLEGLLGGEVRPMPIDTTPLEEEVNLSLVRRPLGLLGHHATLVEQATEASPSLHRLLTEAIDLTLALPREERRLTDEAVEVHRVCRTEAITHEHPPVLTLMIGEQIIIVGRVIGHPQERRLKEAHPLSRETSHIEVIPPEALCSAPAIDQSDPVLE